MITGILFLSLIAMTAPGTAQDTPTAKTSLAKTITWLIEFSAAHRVLMRGSDVYHAGPISSREKCTLEIDMSVARFEKKWSVHHVTAMVTLSRVRHISWLTDVGSLPRHSIRLQSGRTNPAIEEVIKTGDDLTTTTQAITLDLLFDSSDAAAQFERGISHAIFLCGGKASLN
jgi:hypothetical protein